MRSRTNSGIKIITIVIATLIALCACESVPDPPATPVPTRIGISTAPPRSTLRINSEPTPPTVIKLSATPTIPSLFLAEVRPPIDSILSQAQFTEFISLDNVLFEGPPPPSVDFTGYRSSVCSHVEVDTLAEPGDLFLTNEDVFDQVEMAVDGKILEERGDTDYVVHVDLPLVCQCFFDCDNWEYPDWFNEPMPENTGCWYGLGFWGCYPVELETGVHDVSFRFNQTSGSVQEFNWQFELIE